MQGHGGLAGNFQPMTSADLSPEPLGHGGGNQQPDAEAAAMDPPSGTGGEATSPASAQVPCCACLRTHIILCKDDLHIDSGS